MTEEATPESVKPSGPNVIYTPAIPPYVVQEFHYDMDEVGSLFRYEGGTWLDIKGFSRETFAIGYADELKRENPATDYRVVKTDG